MTIINPKTNDRKPSRKKKATGSWRWVTVAWAYVAVIALFGMSIVAAIYFPQVAIYIPIIAVGLAVALQKYTASLAAYLVIVATGIYDLGDRIRIGNIKGDVRSIGMLHTILEEVGEDEKLGGELTGRLLNVPNLLVLDQPVLNYSKDYLATYETITSDYMFDEVRIPLENTSNIEKSCEILENILKKHDEVHINGARQTFQQGYPKFLDEAINGPRVLIHIEPKHVWIKGKFVTPVRGRNELRSQILLEFIKEANSASDIKLA